MPYLKPDCPVLLDEIDLPRTLLACRGSHCGFAERGRARLEPSECSHLERPTLCLLRAYWIIRVDDNQNAKIRLHHRKVETSTSWPDALTSHVESGAHITEKFGSQLDVAGDS